MVSTRSAVQHLKRLLREASSSFYKGRNAGSSTLTSFSACQVRPVLAVNGLPIGPFSGLCVLTRGVLRHSFGSSETSPTRMTYQQLRGAKISGSEVRLSTLFGVSPHYCTPQELRFLVIVDDMQRLRSALRVMGHLCYVHNDSLNLPKLQTCFK